MLYAGEHPRFILRRLIILAGEDIGLADPMGVVVVTSAAQAFGIHRAAGGIYPIVEATLYLATAPKSNTAGSYFKAFQLIEQEGKTGVPQPPAGCKPRCGRPGARAQLQISARWRPTHFLPQQYLPRPLLGTYFYKPPRKATKPRWSTAWHAGGRRSVKHSASAKSPKSPTCRRPPSTRSSTNTSRRAGRRSRQEAGGRWQVRQVAGGK